MRMMQLDLVLGENLEDLHRELECQRSAEQRAAKNLVLQNEKKTENPKH